MRAPDARAPTGRLDEEIRIATRTDGPVPELVIEAWRRSAAAGDWVRCDRPPALQAQFAQCLAEVLLATAAPLLPSPDPAAWDPAPVRLPIGGDVELRFAILPDEGGYPIVEAGLWRCSPNDQTRQFHRTAAGWRVPGHLWPILVEAARKIGTRLEKLSARQAERSLFAPAAGTEP